MAAQGQENAKLSTIYAVENGLGEVLSYHATKGERDAELKWWRDRGNEDAEPGEVTYLPTKRGVVALLNAIKTVG